MDAPKASIILSTYQWPEALAMVLEALHLQSTHDFEIMLADDGSDERTKKVVEDFRARSHLHLQHFWQENKGFRKSKILNEAIQAAKGETLIFLDGDCIPHKEYVAQHIRLCTPSVYVAGRRIDLSEEMTKELTVEKIRSGFLNGSFAGLFHLFLDSFKKKGSRPFHRSYLVKNSVLRKIFGLDVVVDMKGCNFSVKRSHMLAINGFDRSYEGYGREDTDVELRLQNLGLKICSGKNLCLQFHLWHSQRAFTPQNENLLEDVKRSKRVKALSGILESE
ncbi:MAG: glycosyltransferase [Oligoflexia bacterium]|nr:glycosyltransferase [Oligoflexia bacterium]